MSTINYTERIQELQSLLSNRMNVTDAQSVELLLSSQVECGDLHTPWFILDTDYYRLNLDGSWFSYLHPKSYALGLFRVRRPYKTNPEIQDFLRNRDEPILFVESQWRAPSAVRYRMWMWDYLIQECVRLKVPHPKHPISALSTRDHLEIQTAVDRVLDCRWRDPIEYSFTSSPPPKGFYYWCELTQKLNAGLRDWDCLTSNLQSIAIRRARLFNRSVDSTDWAAVSRVMLDCVPEWTKDIIQSFNNQGSLKVIKSKYGKDVIQAELRRLMDQGVVVYSRGKWMLRDWEGQGRDIAAMAGVNMDVKLIA